MSEPAENTAAETDVSPSEEPASLPSQSESSALSGGESDAPSTEDSSQAPASVRGSDKKPPTQDWKGYAFLTVVSFISLVLDLASKHWAETHCRSSAGFPIRREIWKDVLGTGFAFTFAQNRGGAWGFLAGTSESIRKPFFVAVSVVAMIAIVLIFRRIEKHQWALKWGLPLVLGGAVGNFVNRIQYSYVVDFIDFYAKFGGRVRHWPTFNVADIAICVGVVLMGIDLLLAPKPDGEPEAKPDTGTEVAPGEAG